MLIVNTWENYEQNNKRDDWRTTQFFISRLIDSGRYGSTSEVMRSALRLLEQQETNEEIVRQSVIAGLESGESSQSLRDIAVQRKLRHGV